jgi:hypothetical protein
MPTEAPECDCGRDAVQAPGGWVCPNCNTVVREDG